MKTPRLSEGQWVPNLQMYSAGTLYFATRQPFTFPSTIGVSKDPFKNETQSPLIVRSFSSTINWATARDSTTNPLLFDVRVNTVRRGSYKLQQQSVGYAPPANFVTGLYGSLGTAVQPYVWKLAVPALLKQGETILFEYGNVANEGAFTWGNNAQAKANKYSIRCRGKQSQQVVIYGGGGTPSAGSRLTGTHQNLTGEDLEIISITMVVGTVATDRPLFYIEIGGRRVMRGERPFWLFAEPFRYGRYVFDRLPEGGIVLMPNDSIDLTIQNNQYTSLVFTLGLEAYQQVA